MLNRFIGCIGALLLIMSGSFAAHQAPQDVPPAGVIIDHGEHLLCGKSRDGKLELHTGAQFKVPPDEIETVLIEWDYYDHLAICPNPYPMGGSDFYIVNLTRGGFVHANYHNGPKSNSIYTMTIVYADPHEGRISLIDNNPIPSQRKVVHWEVEPKDRHYLFEWENGETVIVGVDDSWYSSLFSTYNFILISYENLNSVKYIRAIPLSDWR